MPIDTLGRLNGQVLLEVAISTDESIQQLYLQAVDVLRVPVLLLIGDSVLDSEATLRAYVVVDNYKGASINVVSGQRAKIYPQLEISA